MATGGARTPDLSQEERDIISFLRQNMAQRLVWEAHKQRLPQTHPQVVQAVRAYFNLGPTSHRAFDRLVWAVANGQ